MSGATGKADLHIHTNEGDGLDTIEAILDHTSRCTDLDVIAITEHDNLDVALRAREVWSRGSYSFEFVPGVEVTTLEGHLVALYLEEPVASLRRVEETVDAVHAGGGVCFIPHPGSWLTRSISAATVARVQAQKARGTWFDAIETANAGPTGRFYLKKARQLSNDQALPGTGSSDAHFVQAIGSAYTVFEGASAADLRAAFHSGAISGKQRAYPSLRDVGLLRAAAVPFKGLGATPRALGWRRTAWSFLSRYVPA